MSRPFSFFNNTNMNNMNNTYKLHNKVSMTNVNYFSQDRHKDNMVRDPPLDNYAKQVFYSSHNY